MYRIDAALAISLIIWTALQVLMFVSSLILRHKSNIALDKAQEMTEQANGIAADAERIHGGAMMCLEMSNVLPHKRRAGQHSHQMDAETLGVRHRRDRYF